MTFLADAPHAATPGEQIALVIFIVAMVTWSIALGRG